MTGSAPLARLKRPPPSIRAVPFSNGSAGRRVELLSEEERAQLLALSRLVEVRRNTIVYAEGGRGNFVYNLVSGVVETYTMLPDGDRRVTAFIFPADLFGLCESGTYVATAQALTPVVAYRMPISALERVVQRDPKLDAALLCKLCHELRQSERHAVVTSQREARVKVASFLLWLHENETDEPDGDRSIRLPMIRHDIADYLGLSVEAVSRALHSLESAGVLTRRTPRLLHLTDMAGLRHVARHD